MGATDKNDAVATFSDTGFPNVAVTAPGVDILSTYPGGGYQTASGTSMAAPFVSGVAELVLTQTPSRTAPEVKRILAASAVKAGTLAYGADPYALCAGCTWNASYGYGRIDVARALATAPPAPAPDFSLAPATDTATVAALKATDAISVKGVSSFAGTVSFSVTGLPTGATASVQPDDGHRLRLDHPDRHGREHDRSRQLPAHREGRERNPQPDGGRHAARPCAQLRAEALPAVGERLPGRQAGLLDLAGQPERVPGHGRPRSERPADGHDGGVQPHLDQRHDGRDADADDDDEHAGRHLSITVTGTSGSLVQTTTLSLTVAVAVPTYSVALTPTSSSISYGRATSISYKLTITPRFGFKGPVALSVSPPPAGTSGAFTATTVSVTSTSAVLRLLQADDPRRHAARHVEAHLHHERRRGHGDLRRDGDDQLGR